MKRDLKINFYILEEIVSEIKKYKSALVEMERSSSSMITTLETSVSKPTDELKSIYRGFKSELNKCRTELNDLDNILSNYINEMQSIIKPVDRYRYMRVDRNDIYFNKQSIISACEAIGNLSRNRWSIGSGTSYAKDPEEKAREEQNYRKLEEIWRNVIPRYARKLNAQVDALNSVYNRKIVPFENKDDEYKTKASRLYYKYTNIWEGIRADFKADTKIIVDIVRGAANAIFDLVKALVGLGWGIISYTASAVVIAVTSPTTIKPKWAEDIFDGTNSAIGNILKDPMLLVEGLSQQVSDTFEEEGAAYSIGYVAGDFLGAKGLDKLARVGKAKLTGVGNVVEDIEDVSKVADDVGETVAEAIETAVARLRALGLTSETEIARISGNAAQAMSKGSKFTESTLALGGKPKGVYEAVTGDAEMIRSITRQNEAADFLASKGYDIEMLPYKTNGNGYGAKPSSNPDYLIDGQVFDCYSPKTTNLRTIWDTVVGKTENQARHVVLNLDDYAGSLDDLAKQFNDWPIDGLDELLAIKNGKIARLFIK